jgi:3D (Asp-Asp-Asp) domain-containing protein
MEYRESIVPMQYVSANMMLSAYTNAKNETNEDNTNTAIMENPTVGWSCAVSRDYMHWLGGRVYIKGYGVRYINDLMNERYKKSIDVYVGTKKEAKKIGRKKDIKVVFLGK